MIHTTPLTGIGAAGGKGHELKLGISCPSLAVMSLMGLSGIWLALLWTLLPAEVVKCHGQSWSRHVSYDLNSLKGVI